MSILIIFALAVYGLIIISGEFLPKIGIAPFISRKISHVLCGVTTSLLPVYFNQIEITITLVLLILLSLIAIKLEIFSNIESSNTINYGTVFFPFGSLISCLLFFNINPLIFIGSVLILSYADPAAAIVGKYFGKYKVRYLSDKKTYEGSLAFFIMSVIIFSLLTYINFTNIDFILSYKGTLIILASFVIAVVEIISKKGSDNVFIPISSGLFLILILA